MMKKNIARVPRLYVPQSLAPQTPVPISADQAHYLGRVMRLGVGDQARLFNGDDGEWLCDIIEITKRRCVLVPQEKLRAAQTLPDVEYLFAPLKVGRLDYMVQKATEMGAARLRPVMTEFTQVKRLKMERLVANTIEAAEQCNLVCLPEVSEPEKLAKVLDTWDENRRLIICDERADSDSPIETLKELAGQPVALLIGPEGGFSEKEHARLLSLPFVTPISLGPRIMRADTAAVAALAVVQSTIGDWG